MRWFVASDGGPSWQGYLMVAGICLASALVVVVVGLRRQRQEIRRNARRLADEAADIEDLAETVIGIRSYLRGRPDGQLARKGWLMTSGPQPALRLVEDKPEKR